MWGKVSFVAHTDARFAFEPIYGLAFLTNDVKSKEELGSRGFARSLAMRTVLGTTIACKHADKGRFYEWEAFFGAQPKLDDGRLWMQSIKRKQSHPLIALRRKRRKSLAAYFEPASCGGKW